MKRAIWVDISESNWETIEDLILFLDDEYCKVTLAETLSREKVEAILESEMIFRDIKRKIADRICSMPLPECPACIVRKARIKELEEELQAKDDALKDTVVLWKDRQAKLDKAVSVLREIANNPDYTTPRRKIAQQCLDEICDGYIPIIKPNRDETVKWLKKQKKIDIFTIINTVIDLTEEFDCEFIYKGKRYYTGCGKSTR